MVMIMMLPWSTCQQYPALLNVASFKLQLQEPSAPLCVRQVRFLVKCRGGVTGDNAARKRLALARFVLLIFIRFPASLTVPVTL